MNGRVRATSGPLSSGVHPAGGGAGAVTADARGGARRAAKSTAPVPVPPLHLWPHISSLELATLPAAVACGRLHAKQVLREWKLDHLASDAETLVSELLTNAVKASWSAHGPGLVALRLLANRERLIVEVWDHSRDDPRPRPVDDQSESGRGLAVIEGLSHRWGFSRVGARLKVVWCELVVGSG